ncbi:MAG: elongation factor G [Candidatus Omnitrophica bacterium]|nr:elongation factor G [Candidatus Omnitrophota bacterium]
MVQVLEREVRSSKKGEAMAQFTTDKIRNIAIMAHSHAGKTSLVEAILFAGGAINAKGTVEAGTTVSDFQADEIARKISINGSVSNCKYRDNKITLLDTPGYADFIGEVLTAIDAADGAILLVNAVSGIEIGAERAWKLIQAQNKPCAIFINKMDKENADFDKTYEAITTKFGKKCTIMTFPIGESASFKGVANLVTKAGMDGLGDAKEKAKKLREALIETAAEADDELLEKYLEAGELTDDEFKSAFGAGVKAGTIVPVLCGSATSDAGVKELLDMIIDLMPSPALQSPKKGKNPKGSEEEVREPKADMPFSAQVIKTIIDPYVGQLSIFRIFSGNIALHSSFYNVTTGERERVTQLLEIQGKNHATIDKAEAGDIVAVAKLKNTHTGDSLADEKSPIMFDQVVLPEPAISFSVKPKSKGDVDKISAALAKLSSEDCTFKITRDAQTRELIVAGLGDLHLDIMLKRLKERYHVEVDKGTPKVAYKETITAKSEAQYKHKKQSGGAGQFAEVWLRVEPLAHGTGFEFVSEVVGGAIPGPFIVSCEKGIRTALDKGVLAGYPIVDVRAVVYDGKTHSVDSKDIAFQMAARHAFKEAFLKAKPVLLEPIMEVEITVPEECMGDISGSVNSKRGRILGMGVSTISAHIPLAEMFKYAPELKSLTAGRGTYTMRFSNYEQVPAKTTEAVIAQAKQAKEGEE